MPTRSYSVGEAAGGDKRGKQSAALPADDNEDYPLLDLRDDDPLIELAQLEGVAREWVHYRRLSPNRESPAGRSPGHISWKRD